MINVQLKTNLTEENLHLNAIADFPYASVVVYDLKTDTLSEKNNLYAEVKTLSVYFHLPDIFFRRFTIKKIGLHDGLLMIRSVEDESSGSNSIAEKIFDLKTDLSLDLNASSFHDIKIILLNDKQPENEIRINDATLAATWQNSKRQLTLNGDFDFGYYDKDDLNIFKEIILSLILNFNEETIAYEVISGNAEYNGIKVYLNNSSISSKQMNLKLASASLTVDKIIHLLPDSLSSAINQFDLGGNIMLNADIVSYFQSGANPYITGSFSSEDIFLKIDNLPKIEKLRCQGSFSNGNHRELASSAVQFNQIRFRAGSSEFEMEAGINDLLKPEINFQLRGTLQMKDLPAYLKDSLGFITKGKMDIALRYKRQRPGWGAFRIQDVLYSRLYGKLDLTGMNLQAVYYPLEVEIKKGFVFFNNNNIRFDSLVVSSEESLIVIDAGIDGFFSALLFGDQNIEINSEIYAPCINVNDFITEVGSASKRNYQDKQRISWKGQLLIDSLVYDKFTATHIASDYHFADDTLQFASMNLKAFEGDIRASGNIIFADRHSFLKLFAELDKTKIEKLFYEMNDFGQESISFENISGDLNADIIFKATIDSSFRPLLSSIHVTSDVEINKGRLFIFKPLVESLKILNEDSLSDMHFSTLKNQIEIKDQYVIIPKMNIRSNALNFEGYGKHSFTNEFDYHFKILLSDILSKKAKSKKNKLEEYGYIEDDGYGKTALYFHLTGNLDDYQFRYDKKALKEKIISDFQREKQRIAEDFNEEFKWLKRDSAKRAGRETVKQFFKEQEEGNFILEWDMENDSTFKKDL